MKVFLKCRKCGAGIDAIRIGDVYDVACAECGASYSFHANPARPSLPPELLVPVLISVKWKTGSPSHREIGALQRLFPSLATQPIVAIYNSAKGKSIWALGEETLAHAQRLVAEAQEMDLELCVEAKDV